MRGVFRRPPLPSRGSPRYEDAVRNPYNLARSCHCILNFCRCAFSHVHTYRNEKGLSYVVSLHLNGFRGNCKIFSEFRAHVHVYKRASRRYSFTTIFTFQNIRSKQSFEIPRYRKEKLNFFFALIKILPHPPPSQKKWIELKEFEYRNSHGNDRRIEPTISILLVQTSVQG